MGWMGKSRTEWEELDSQPLRKSIWVSGQLLSLCSGQNWRHSGLRVRTRESVYACGRHAVGVRVEFGSRSHLVTLVQLSAQWGVGLFDQVEGRDRDRACGGRVHQREIRRLLSLRYSLAGEQHRDRFTSRWTDTVV